MPCFNGSCVRVSPFSTLVTRYSISDWHGNTSFLLKIPYWNSELRELLSGEMHRYFVMFILAFIPILRYSRTWLFFVYSKRNDHHSSWSVSKIITLFDREQKDAFISRFNISISQRCIFWYPSTGNTFLHGFTCRKIITNTFIYYIKDMF